VILKSGILGKVQSVSEDFLTVEIASNVKVKVEATSVEAYDPEKGKADKDKVGKDKAGKDKTSGGKKSSTDK